MNSQLPTAYPQPQPPTNQLTQRSVQHRSGMAGSPPPPPGRTPPGYIIPDMVPRWAPGPPPAMLAASTSKAALNPAPGLGPQLLLPSRQALVALLAVPLVLWVGCVVAGTAAAEPLPPGISKKDFEHPLIGFDKHVFRVWGPLLPLFPWLTRCLALRLPLSTGGRAGPPAGSGVALRPLCPCVTLPLPCLAVYGIVIVVRVALYGIHVALQRWGPMALVSDHMLLAASVVACFQSELVMCLSDVFKTELLRGVDWGSGARQLVVVTAMVTSMFILVFVYGDMYCTARWYHKPAESLGALVAGAAVFNCPIVWWVLHSARKS